MLDALTGYLPTSLMEYPGNEMAFKMSQRWMIMTLQESGLR